MPKVWNKRDPNVPKDAVYVGRPTKWGNPFKIGRDGDREAVISKFRDMILQTDTFWSVKRHQVLVELKGKDLVCWCAPEPCHADILLELANAPTKQT